MKILFLIPFLAIALHAEPIFFQPQSWALGVSFPEKPKTSERKTKQPKFEFVSEFAGVEQRDHLWSAERTTYSFTIPKDRIDGLYDGGKRGMLKARPGKIVREEVLEMCGHVGRRYIVEYKHGTRLAEHRVVIIGNSLFQFMYERPIADEDHPHEFFLSIRKKPNNTLEAASPPAEN